MANGTTAGVNAQLPIGAAISGRVTAESNGAAITNVQLQVRDPSGNQIGFAATAADGTFHVLGLTGGVTVTVCFDGEYATAGPSVAGYLNDCYRTGVGTSPSPITVTAGSTVTGIDAALASGGGISSTVRFGTAPVDGDVLALFAPDGTGISRDEGNTGSDGTYRISALRPGTYLVCFDASEANPPSGDQCYHDAVWEGTGPPPLGADQVTVTAGAITQHIDASLTP